MNNTYENEVICGKVTEIIYYNSDNGYTVCEIETKDDTFTAVGCMPYISNGEPVKLTGRWVFHQEYGPQFKVEYYEKEMPTKLSDILKYLSSGSIRGVRSATAEKIVDMFGEEAFNIIENEPEKLAKINGISKKRALEISEDFIKQQEIRNIVIFMQKLDISPAIAVKVYKRFGSSTIDIIKKNPYVLSEKIFNIGFKFVDNIAFKMGIEPNSPIRIEASIKYILNTQTLNGHTYLPKNILVDETTNFLQIEHYEIENILNQMILELKLKSENIDGICNVYLPSLYEAEVYVATKLKIISANKINNDIKEIEKLIKSTEKETKIKLEANQKSAVICGLINGASIITGGPGTGKTTIINTIIKIMNDLNKTVLLAAPTGRAAKRMSEVCKIEAKTIHRLLESTFSDSDDNLTFSRNESNPLECDMVIIDEMSMVDIMLMKSLLKAISKNTCIIMVGDSDQLPSVGAGNVLHDIIKSNIIPTISLNEIFRQAKKSAIVVNAHKINHGQMPVVNENGTDFFLLKRDNSEDITSSIVDLYKNRLPSAYNFNPKYQIQVLSPTRKGLTGVNELNKKLQDIINNPSKTKKEKKFKSITFREGDKVMQTKNNYDMEWVKIDDESQFGFGIFNGDIGFIDKIDTHNEVAHILFDDKRCKYPFNKMDELDLAYAITVHKSQGNEFDAIIIPMYPCAPMLQNRNLLYTAVTRAKKIVVLVGREGCVKTMIENVGEHKRYSGLENKLRWNYNEI